MIWDKTVQLLSSAWVILCEGREGKGREGWRRGLGGKRGIHYTENWLDGGLLETLISAEIQIPSESVVESSWNHKIIVLAQTRSDQNERLRGSSGFNFGVECGGCRGWWPVVCFPSCSPPTKSTQALCAHRKLYPCWLNGFCSRVFCCCFFIFSINYLLALRFCMLNILGSTHLCFLYSWVQENNYEMGPWVWARQAADCN